MGATTPSKGVEAGSSEGGKTIVLALSRDIPLIVKQSLLLFVFSMPFEYVDLGLPMTPSRLTGLLFFATYAYHYNPMRSGGALPRIPCAMWWFLGYVAVYAINILFFPSDNTQELVVRIFTLSQLIVLFWLASSLLEHEKVSRSVLLTYAISACLVAIGILLSLPGFVDPQSVGDVGRETGLGQNANTLGTIMALAALTSIGLFLSSPMSKFRRLMLLSAAVPVLVMMVNTGSRAAVGAFVIGCAVYFMPSLRVRRKITAIVMGIVGIIVLIFMIAERADFAERWEAAYYEGDLATREEIYPTAIEMIAERPIMGWQGVAFMYELGRRLGVPSGIRDSHNLYLYVLLEVGFSGAIPFFIGLALCGAAAWKAREGPLGQLPAVLLLTILAANMTHTYVVEKAHWLIFGLAIASATALSKKQNIRIRVKDFRFNSSRRMPTG